MMFEKQNPLHDTDNTATDTMCPNDYLKPEQINAFIESRRIKFSDTALAALAELGIEINNDIIDNSPQNDFKLLKNITKQYKKNNDIFFEQQFLPESCYGVADAKNVDIHRKYDKLMDTFIKDQAATETHCPEDGIKKNSIQECQENFITTHYGILQDIAQEIDNDEIQDTISDGCLSVTSESDKDIYTMGMIKTINTIITNIQFMMRTLNSSFDYSNKVLKNNPLNVIIVNAHSIDQPTVITSFTNTRQNINNLYIYVQPDEEFDCIQPLLYEFATIFYRTACDNIPFLFAFQNRLSINDDDINVFDSELINKIFIECFANTIFAKDYEISKLLPEHTKRAIKRFEEFVRNNT